MAVAVGSVWGKQSWQWLWGDVWGPACPRHVVLDSRLLPAVTASVPAYPLSSTPERDAEGFRTAHR